MDTTVKHTQEYDAISYGDAISILRRVDGREIARDIPWATALAAPDMLAALEEIVSDLGDLMRHGSESNRQQALAAWNVARAAIAKAKS